MVGVGGVEKEKESVEGEGERERGGRGEQAFQAEAFELSACQRLMIELKYFCHESSYEKLFEKYSCFKVSAVISPQSRPHVVLKQRWH